MDQSDGIEAAVFNGIEDVEISPNGMVYFAVKGPGIVYRFQDSNPINGTDVTMEIFVGGDIDYNIIHNGGKTNLAWGLGNDNLTFDEKAIYGYFMMLL